MQILMQGVVDGALVRWPSYAQDWDASDYPGEGTPSLVAVASEVSPLVAPPIAGTYEDDDGISASPVSLAVLMADDDATAGKTYDFAARVEVVTATVREVLYVTAWNAWRGFSDGWQKVDTIATTTEGDFTLTIAKVSDRFDLRIANASFDPFGAVYQAAVTVSNSATAPA